MRYTTTMNDEYFLERLAVSATQRIGSLASIIIHTVLFVGIFGLHWLGFSNDKILLILTTIVSLEAIYLAIFIQMTINRQARQIAEVSHDVEDIQENVEEISKDLDEIQEDVEHIEENVEDLSDELEKEDKEDAIERTEDQQKIANIEHVLVELLREIKTLKAK